MKIKILPFLLAAALCVLCACSPGGGSDPASSPESGASSGESSSGPASSDPSSAGSEPGSSAPSSGASSAASASSRPASSAASQPEKAATVKVTVPEGFTLSQIGDRLQAKKVCTKTDFVKAAQTYDFSYYSLVGKIPNDPNRCYRLEGYLYPDTYEFYVGMKPEDAVGKFLRNAEDRIGTKYSYSGMTTDQVVTLASIIEREADDPDNMKKVSSVFHNRLKAHMILQADSTREYCNDYLIPVFGDDSKYHYNTYPDRAPALPAGPICSPGANALSAAAHPADTDYLYFATGTDHKYYYGATQAERDAQMAAAGVTPLYKD